MEEDHKKEHSRPVSQASISVADVFATYMPYAMFVAAGLIFFATGFFLKISLIYCLVIIGVLLLGLFLHQPIFCFLALLPFSYSLWGMKAVSGGDVLLFSLGFVSAFVFLMQLGVSGAREMSPLVAAISGIIFALFYILFSAMNYETFSSLFLVSPFGILLIVTIIVFFRFQYFVWKGK